MYNFRTDLASERKEIYKQANKLEEIDGIETNEEEINENIKVERVKITNENGEKAIGKPIRKLHYHRHQKTKNSTRRRNWKSSKNINTRIKTNTRSTYW